MAYDRPLSRPVRVVESDLSSGVSDVVTRQTRVSAITVTAKANDVNVTFKNGANGEVLWDMEADNAAGSSNQTFGYHPLLFTQGVRVEVDIPSNLKAINIALVEPQSAGT